MNEEILRIKNYERYLDSVQYETGTIETDIQNIIETAEKGILNLFNDQSTSMYAVMKHLDEFTAEINTKINRLKGVRATLSQDLNQTKKEHKMILLHYRRVMKEIDRCDTSMKRLKQKKTGAER